MFDSVGQAILEPQDRSLLAIVSEREPVALPFVSEREPKMAAVCEPELFRCRAATDSGQSNLVLNTMVFRRPRKWPPPKQMLTNAAGCHVASA